MPAQVYLHAQDLVLDFGDGRLLDNANFQISNKQRIAIIGRNGAGKSSLIKTMQGIIKPDSGSCQLQSGIITAQLEQSIPENLPGTILDWVSKDISESDAWDKQHLPEMIISELKLDPNAEMANLSGGTIRRALLAKALVLEPDILFLDEPTNHLDIDSIRWLEDYLQQYNKAIVFVTHDRLFMQAVATRIFELDRGQLLCWDGTYYNFLKHKQTLLEAEQTANALFDKKLAEEEKWIRQGIKARRTRNEGRVRALKKMREERTLRREQSGNINLSHTASKNSAREIIKAEHLTITREGKTLLQDFSITIMRGDKIGIIGPNGCGKSSLIKTLLGQLQPAAGKIKNVPDLQVAYLDQHRQQLDLDATAQDAVSEGSDQVIVNGKPKHIIGYLQDFMFTPQKSRSKVRVLSGGERNRLLLAKILLKPCDILVMDEPTNDLDIESLELLEEFLVNFNGTLLLVSHDRSLLNNAVTNCLVFNNNAKIENLIGGYDDAMAQLTPKTSSVKKPSAAAKKPAPKQQDYKLRKNIEKLTQQITKLENKITELHQAMGQADFYTQAANIIADKQAELKSAEDKLSKLYAEWEQLEQQ